MALNLLDHSLLDVVAQLEPPVAVVRLNNPDTLNSLTFALPPDERILKVTTNAVASTPPPPTEDGEQQYSMRYQVTDLDGRVLIDRVYWQKSRQRVYFDPNIGADMNYPEPVGLTEHMASVST